MSLLPYGTTSTSAPVLHHAAWCRKSVIAHGSGPTPRAADTQEYTQFGADSWDSALLGSTARPCESRPPQLLGCGPTQRGRASLRDLHI